MGGSQEVQSDAFTYSVSYASHSGVGCRQSRRGVEGRGGEGRGVRGSLTNAPLLRVPNEAVGTTGAALWSALHTGQRAAHVAS